MWFNISVNIFVIIKPKDIMIVVLLSCSWMICFMELHVSDTIEYMMSDGLPIITVKYSGI